MIAAIISAVWLGIGYMVFRVTIKGNEDKRAAYNGFPGWIKLGTVGMSMVAWPLLLPRLRK